jgi:hypothetical protein
MEFSMTDPFISKHRNTNIYIQKTEINNRQGPIPRINGSAAANQREIASVLGVLARDQRRRLEAMLTAHNLHHSDTHRHLDPAAFCSGVIPAAAGRCPGAFRGD